MMVLQLPSHNVSMKIFSFTPKNMQLFLQYTKKEIHKIYDIRVVVVGEKVFATAIHSQEYAETEVDWRAWDLCDFSLRHEPIELPSEISARCRSITVDYNLTYSAIDLVLGQDGAYYFLEMNPNGQWAWIEHKTGYAIRDALIDSMGY